MKMWRAAIHKVFMRAEDVYPCTLGDIRPATTHWTILRDIPSFNAVIDSYDEGYQALLCQQTIEEVQARGIINLLLHGQLYDGSDYNGMQQEQDRPTGRELV